MKKERVHIEPRDAGSTPASGTTEGSTMNRPYPEDNPIKHHFVVRSTVPGTEKRYINEKARWIRRELSTALHDESISVEVVYE